MQSSTSRLPGLDTLRALAILLVFANHYRNFVTDTAPLGFVGEIGWVGVDLFFALSGYLIGNQILAGLKHGTFSLPRFAARRLLRTLPNYYVVLALYAWWPLFAGTAKHAPWWEYLTFTLNLGLVPGTRFSHAWSLCVEEQFYFALPLVAVLVTRARGALALGWVLLAAGLGAGMLFRHHGWELAYPPGWKPAWGNGAFYTHVYYATLCRFDELLVGVALALVRQCHAPLWARLTSYGNWTFALGIAVTAGAFALFLDDHFGHAVTVFGYPLLALGFGLLVLAALSPASLLARVRVPGAAAIALWSYAIYLTHKQLIVILATPLRQWGVDPGSWAGVGVLALASVLAGWLLYALVETPFMRLRERYVRAVPAPRAPAQPIAA